MANWTEEIIYNGINCSNFGYRVCYFEKKNGFEKRIAPANKVYNRIKTNASNEFYITSKKYEEPYKFTIQLCKTDGTNITASEQEALSDWLDVDDYKEFQFCNDDMADTIFYAICINKQRVLIDRQYGWELEFECNAPYGYGVDEIEYEIDTNSTSTLSIMDWSSVRSEIYPFIEIKITSSGQFTIENQMTNKTVIFENCESNEIITMNKNNILSSSTRGSDIFADNNFNYTWFSIGYKDNDNRENIINFNGTAKANVTIKFRYNKSVGE